MKISKKDLQKPRHVTHSGDRSAFKDVYSLFPDIASHLSPASLALSLTIQPQQEYGYEVKGWVEFCAQARCNRCEQPVLHKLHRRDICVYFNSHDKVPEDAGDRDLDHRWLDFYALNDGMLDIEGLVIDQIHLDWPSRFTCPDCDRPLKDDLVYSNRDPQKHSPFAALLDLKLDSSQ